LRMPAESSASTCHEKFIGYQTPSIGMKCWAKR
jgi:hypothetical protein